MKSRRCAMESCHGWLRRGRIVLRNGNRRYSMRPSPEIQGVVGGLPRKDAGPLVRRLGENKARHSRNRRGQQDGTEQDGALALADERRQLLPGRRDRVLQRAEGSPHCLLPRPGRIVVGSRAPQFRHPGDLARTPAATCSTFAATRPGFRRDFAGKRSSGDRGSSAAGWAQRRLLVLVSGALPVRRGQVGRRR